MEEQQLKSVKVGFIGGGNMANAIGAGLINKGNFINFPLFFLFFRFFLSFSNKLSNKANLFMRKHGCILSH